MTKQILGEAPNDAGYGRYSNKDLAFNLLTFFGMDFLKGEVLDRMDLPAPLHIGAQVGGSLYLYLNMLGIMTSKSRAGESFALSDVAEMLNPAHLGTGMDSLKNLFTSLSTRFFGGKDAG